MPIGPKGEKRPADPIQSPVLLGKIATGEIEEKYVEKPTRAPNRAGGWQEGRKSPGQVPIGGETHGDRQSGSCCPVERRGDRVTSG